MKPLLFVSLFLAVFSVLEAQTEQIIDLDPFIEFDADLNYRIKKQ